MNKSNEYGTSQQERTLQRENDSYTSRLSKAADNTTPTITLAVTAVLSAFFALDNYYSMMPLFGAPALVTGTTNYQEPAPGNNYAGLFTYVTGAAPETSSFLNFGSGAVLLLALFLTIFGTASLAGMVVREQAASLLVSVLVSAVLGYIYGIFTKVARDANMTWFLVWTVIIVLAVVVTAALSVWKFFSVKPEDTTGFFTRSRKTLFWVSAGITAVGAILLLVEHYHMGTKINGLTAS